MNVTNTLEKLKINPAESVHIAVKRVQQIIDESSDKLMSANKIITMLGAPIVGKERTASVLAKGLVEQALVQGDKYKPEDAMTVVVGKYMKLVDDMPGVYGAKADPWKEPLIKSTSAGRSTGSSGDKKLRAMQIFEANKSLGNSDIAKKIAKDLDITFANAYYYCSRVFVR